MWLVFNSFVYYILCQSNKPFKLRYLPKTKYQPIADILRDCRKSPKVAILALMHVMKSDTYKHQNHKFRVFRQSLGISIRQYATHSMYPKVTQRITCQALRGCAEVRIYWRLACKSLRVERRKCVCLQIATRFIQYLSWA